MPSKEESYSLLVGSINMLIRSGISLKWKRLVFKVCGRANTSYELQVRNKNPPVTSLNSRVTSSNTQVTSSNPWVTSSNPRDMGSN